MNELEGKELAIAVAEKLGEPFEQGEVDYRVKWEDDFLKNYLSEKAWQIFKKHAAKINDYIIANDNWPLDWYRDITPEKILNVFLKIED